MSETLPVYSLADLRSIEAQAYGRGRTDEHAWGEATYLPQLARLRAEAEHLAERLEDWEDAARRSLGPEVARGLWRTVGNSHLDVVRRRAEASGHPEVYAGELATAERHHARVWASWPASWSGLDDRGAA